jgi:ubiquinone/menaquinone biosynthesis C-methylase UbiE
MFLDLRVINFILRLLKIECIRVCHYKGKFLWLNIRQIYFLFKKNQIKNVFYSYWFRTSFWFRLFGKSKSIRSHWNWIRQFSLFCMRLALVIFRRKEKFHKEKYRILIMKANEMHYFSNVFENVLYMFRTGPLCIIRSISTMYTRNRYLSC